jgi:hypothetical protein
MGFVIVAAASRPIPPPAPPLKGGELCGATWKGELSVATSKGRRPYSLPFKGRVGEGMGFVIVAAAASRPIPLQLPP